MNEDESVSASWLALIAFSREAGLMDDFLVLVLCTRLAGAGAEAEAAGWACSEGHAHSDATKCQSRPGDEILRNILLGIV